ncbi:MAG TPA: hypothetical protein VLL48_05830, partial [Longimicrobiales bacterium]|nr:hypothetical protein [Longimicrobiales bacterium]
EKAPSLLRILGELRQMIFAWEIRCTRGLVTPEATDEDAEQAEPESGGEDPTLSASLRIVREALERERELHEELRNDHPGEDGEE